MEREKSNIANEEELKHAGRQAADALRGYGYSDFAQQYEQALQRSALAPKEVLTHSRIANTTLQELNTLQAERHTNHPAVERNIQIQEQLEAALQKQQESSVQKTRSIEDLSFPAKMYLEENSKPLESAAQEVANYLDEKRAYSHSVEGKTKLQGILDVQLQSYRSLPTSHNIDNLERYTKQGIQVMRDDFEQAKTTLQRENSDYVRERQYLSPEGKRTIQREAEQGEFRMPNQQKGHIVESRTDYAQQQLDQYTKTKEQIFSIDRERTEGPSWTMPTAVPAESTVDRDRQEQALSSPAVEKDAHKSAGISTEQIDTWRTTLEKDYSHLSNEQQERYADLQRNIAPAVPSKDKEMEL